MSQDDVRKTMEFLIEQQAQFAARIEKDEGRLTKLENAFVTLVELVRLNDERMDTFSENLNSLTRNMNALTERMEELAEAQANTQETLHSLINIVERHISEANE